MSDSEIGGPITYLIPSIIALFLTLAGVFVGLTRIFSSKELIEKYKYNYNDKIIKNVLLTSNDDEKDDNSIDNESLNNWEARIKLQKIGQGKTID